MQSAVCGYRLGQFCRRTAIRFWTFCVQGVGQRLWRAGCEGDPLVSMLRVCGAMPPLANTGKPSWWCFHSLQPSGYCMYRTAVTIRTAQRSLYVPHSGHYMYSTVVTICTASLTFNNSTFCPHSVFMCFVWISEQTAIISLYSIN